MTRIHYGNASKTRNPTSVFLSFRLGFWVVREAARDAFKRRAEKFDTKKEALKCIDSRLRA